jgi:hypothetical protein
VVSAAASAPSQDSYGSPQGNAVQQSQPSYGRARREAPETDEKEEDLTEEEELDASASVETTTAAVDLSDVGVQKVIQVVSSGDLTFAIKESDNETSIELYPPVTQSWAGEQGYICMSTPAFAATLVILLAILVISCLLSAFLCLRHRSYYGDSSLIAAFANPVFAHKKGHF